MSVLVPAKVILDAEVIATLTAAAAVVSEAVQLNVEVEVNAGLIPETTAAPAVRATVPRMTLGPPTTVFAQVVVVPQERTPTELPPALA